MDSNCFYQTTQEGQSLTWIDWGGLFIAYQPSSTETHAFDGVAKAFLEAGAVTGLTLDQFKQSLTQDFALVQEDMEGLDLRQIAYRLEELGLIEVIPRTSAQGK